MSNTTKYKFHIIARGVVEKMKTHFKLIISTITIKINE